MKGSMVYKHIHCSKSSVLEVDYNLCIGKNIIQQTAYIIVLLPNHKLWSMNNISDLIMIIKKDYK